MGHEEPVERQEPGERDALVRNLESLLFVADEPLTATQLAKLLEIEREAVEAGLAALAEACRDRGVRLQSHNGSFQMVTAPESAPLIERLLGATNERRLSGAALEVLAIVAYRQPITRAGIDAIRGVNSDRALRTLQLVGMVTEAGRMETAGRPVLWGTTFEFLQHFGLSSLADLPPMPETAGPSGVELAQQLPLPAGEPGGPQLAATHAMHAMRRYDGNGNGDGREEATR